MSGTVVLELGRTPGQPVRWSNVAGGAIVSAGEVPDAFSLGGACSGADKVIAVLPGETAAMRTLSPPPASAAKFRAAAALLLEDELATGADRTHIAIAKHESGAGIVLAINAELFNSFIAAFDDAGVNVDVLTADIALLQLSDKTASLVIEEARLFGAIGFHGIAFERPSGDRLAAEALSGNASLAVKIFCERQADAVGFAELAEAEFVYQTPAERVIGYATSALEGAPNFYQGAYRKRRNWQAEMAPWRRAGMLGIACSAALVAGQAITAIQNDRLAGAISAKMREIHREAFPDAANVNPVTHARSVLSAKPSGAGFLALTGVVSEALSAQDAIQLQRIRYNASRAEYSIQLRFADINELERLKRALGEKGLDVAETGGVRRSGGLYVGELQVGGS